MGNTKLILTLIAAVAAGWLPSLAFAQAGAADDGPRVGTMRDLLEEALDQRVDSIVIDDKPLAEAFAQLEQHTGVRFELDATAIDRMPYGARTRVSLAIEDMSLRDACGQLLDGLGLRMDVLDDHVRVSSAAVLDRVGRRITIHEASTLARLAQTEWNETTSAIPLQFELSQRWNESPEELLAQAVAHAPGRNAVEQLENAAESLGCVWLVNNDAIVLRSREIEVQRRLDRPNDMTYQRIALDDLLVDLGRRVGVTMFFQPGCLQQVAARDRFFDVIQRGVSVRQTLERLCGGTGLRYEVDADGVHFAGPENAETRSVARSSRLVRISIPIGGGASVDYILREEELPAELRARYEALLEETLSRMIAGEPTQ